MKLLAFFTLLFFLGLTNTVTSQIIEGEKGVLHKHAKVNIQLLKQANRIIGDGIKVPNPGWQPREWSFSDNIIYRQPKTYTTTKESGNRIISPIPDTTFAGLMDNGNSIPPDVNAAAGPMHLMQTLNTDVRISDKLGNELFTTSLDAWWADLPGGSTFDPKIVFDPYQNRWIMITPSGSTATTSKMYIGVSTTENPLDDWNFYWIETDPESILWFDYPNLGFNKKWISIGGIMRNSAFEAVEFVVFTFDKLSAYAGEEEVSLSRFTTTIGSAIVPASTYDSLSEDLYLISTGNGNYLGEGFVNLFKLSGVTDDPSFELKGSLAVPEPWENWSYENHGDFLPQLGSSEKLNSVDARMHTMIFRNNKLWAVHHIYLPANDPQYAAIQWWNLDTTGVILQRGRIEDPDQITSFAFPSIAVNANEDVIIGHGVFSENHYAGAAYSYKDHLDDEGSMRDYYIYKEGLAPYHKTFGGDRNRWGDYSAVFVDPVDDIDFWAVHEFADLPNGSDKWGTWWAFLKPSFSPLADFDSDETLIPLGESVDFTDLSLGVPTNWEWTFEGGIPGNSSQQNPTEILFDQEGSFDVTLISSNDLGSDTIVKEDFITTSISLLPEVDFTVSKTAICTGSEVEFTDKTIYSPIEWEWQFDPSSVIFVNGTNETSQNPEVIFEEAVLYSVSLKVWNLNGSSEITKFEFIAAGGYPLPFMETFEDDSFVSDDWLIENPDNSNTWEMQNVAGNIPGNKAMSVKFADYFVGRRDRLISPPFNLTNSADALLEFEHAYAKKYEPITDSLIIYISADCGQNWERLSAWGEDGSGSFATHEMTDDFWPQTDTDWCGNGWGAQCNLLDLSSWDLQPNLRIAFESYSGVGNPIFVDNVSVGALLGTDEKINYEPNLVVYPNPTDGNFSVKLPAEFTFTELRLFNYLGKTVLNKKINPADKIINIQTEENWAVGVYFLSVSGTEKQLTIKVVLK